MVPRPDVSEERTEQIIEAAIAVFVRKGLNEARMVDIADEAGLSKATLYLYFDSKDDLIGAILEAFVARELEEGRRLLTAAGTAASKLNRLLDVMMADTKALLPVIPLYLDFLALAVREEAIRAVIQEPFYDFLEILTTIVEQGIASGEFRAVDARATALLFGTIFDGTFLLWGYDPEMIDIEEQMRSSVALVLSGLKA